VRQKEGTYLGPGGTEISYKPFLLADIKVQWSANKYQIFTEATNLFNTDYLYIGNLPQPRRWIKAGVNFIL